MKSFELKKIKNYLDNKFNVKEFQLKDDIKNNSCEVYFENEFLGLIYKDEEDGEISYQFHMTILDEDLLDG